MTYIWRNLLQRKVRTLLSMLGVAVSIAGVVALVSVSDGMMASLDSYMSDSGASLTVFNREAAGLEFSEVRAVVADQVEQMEGVEAVARANATVVMKAPLGEGRESPGFLPCFGRIFGERLLERTERLLVAGRMPKESHEILVGRLVSEQTGLKTGDRLPLFHGTYLGITEYEVVGEFESDVAWENTAVILDAKVVQEQRRKKDAYTMLFVYTTPEATQRVKTIIEEQNPDLIAVPAGQFMSRFETQTDLINQFTGLVVAIALVIGVLGVLNTMMMSVAERTREIGMLRALGWSRGLIARAIVTEGILLSTIGGLFGLALGITGTEVLVRFFQGGLLEAAYLPKTFIGGMAVALFVGVLAAIYPAWRAANMRPVEALRYE
ncbi:MAG: FtsX-like permease family protein [Planctomycetota bacterium]